MPSDPGREIRQRNIIHLAQTSLEWANVSSTRIRSIIRDSNWTACDDLHPGVKAYLKSKSN